MKTGASESFARVPTQLMTMLKCLPDFLIFSDMEQDIGGQKIHDSLATVLSEAQEGNSDFDLYRRQKQCLVDQENCNKQGDPAREGWNLDKYKNVHIAEKAYAMRPNYDWYLFVDADTYVLWPNLMQWLKKLDPTKKLYLGSVTMIGGFHFGHGGSGYLVSQAAMKEMVVEHPGIANKFDVRAKSECCGDYIFALALKDTTDVGVQNMVGVNPFSYVPFSSASLACLPPPFGPPKTRALPTFLRNHTSKCRSALANHSPSSSPSIVAHYQRRETRHAPLRPVPLVPSGRDDAPHERRRDQLLLAL